MINEFVGRYRWLSNFQSVDVVLENIRYPSVEHAYVASKTTNRAIKLTVRNLPTPAKAKAYGKTIALRSNWEEVKLPIMRSLLKQKFEHPILKQLLLDTGDRRIVEGNWWGDTYWGICDNVGENHLGKLIMEVREEMRSGQL